MITAELHAHVIMTQYTVCKLVVRVQRKTVVVGNVITAELHAHVITDSACACTIGHRFGASELAR